MVKLKKYKCLIICLVAGQVIGGKTLTVYRYWDIHQISRYQGPRINFEIGGTLLVTRYWGDTRYFSY